MLNDRLPPIHPGEILREEFLKPLNITPAALAHALHVPRTRLTRLTREETALTADTALRLSHFFGNSAQFWLNLQNSYDLKKLSAQKKSDIAEIQQYRPAA